MANEEHVEIVKQGTDAIASFWEGHPKVVLDLSGADLSGADLSGADLSYANLSGADLSYANLSLANLGEADLLEANLSHAHLLEANLSHANLREANLSHANLSEADLSGANLGGAELRRADLSGADLSRAHLAEISFDNCALMRARLEGACLSWSTFSHVDLSGVRDLESIDHREPSSLDTHTLRASKGKIPDSFLRGIGFSPWEVLNAKLYDPSLNANQLAEINDAMFKKLVGNPIGGIFISYSHEDIEFVERLHTALDEQEYPVWRDVHDLVAGPLERQVFDAIRINDVVLIVLSEHSVGSDWVEAELDKARIKEKKEGRPVLCPVTVDVNWEARMPDDADEVLWRTVKKKVVLDFSGWDGGGFDTAFAKLLKGLPRYYGVMEGAGAKGGDADG